METKCGQDIDTAAALLQQGQLVAIPTETVYGLAANALDENAVLKIYKTKNRPAFNPLIVHVGNWEQAMQYTQQVPSDAVKLAQQCWPGPLTLLLPKNRLISDLVTAGSSKIAVRIPRHSLTLALLKHIPFPVAAPSANPSGYVSPTTALHVYEGLNGKIPYILDGGDCEVGLESTIVGWDNHERPVIYRLGGTSVEKIESILGKKVEVALNKAENPDTPGQLKSHYATHTPLLMGNIKEQIAQNSGKSIAVITLSKSAYDGAAYHFLLSEIGDLDEAAKNLFKVLREADHCGASLILCETMPAIGLGTAINDRLKRAQVIYK